MMKNRMPVIFARHGSPMMALEDNEITRGLRRIEERVLTEYGKPRAILAISAHWYVGGKQRAYKSGAGDGGEVEVFNDACNLGSMSMTGFVIK